MASPAIPDLVDLDMVPNEKHRSAVIAVLGHSDLDVDPDVGLPKAPMVENPLVPKRSQPDCRA